MPLMRCTLNGGQGWKWGESGKCYPTQAEALEQARAIMANRSKDEKPEFKDAEPLLTPAELRDTDLSDLQQSVAKLQGFLEAKIPDLATKSDVHSIVGKAISNLPKPAHLSNKQLALIVPAGVALITALTTWLTSLVM